MKLRVLPYADDMPGIWRIPSAGSEETKVLQQPATSYWGYWAITSRGIYSLDSTSQQARILFYDMASQKTTPVASLERYPPPYSGISVDRNDDQLVHRQAQRDVTSLSSKASRKQPLRR